MKYGINNLSIKHFHTSDHIKKVEANASECWLPASNATTYSSLVSSADEN